MAHKGPISLQEIAFPDWRRSLQTALLETDPHKVQERVFSLEEALVWYTEFLVEIPQGEAEDEKLAIRDALRILRTLQVERLNYPDWKRE